MRFFTASHVEHRNTTYPLAKYIPSFNIHIYKIIKKQQLWVRSKIWSNLISASCVYDTAIARTTGFLRPHAGNKVCLWGYIPPLLRSSSIPVQPNTISFFFFKTTSFAVIFFGFSLLAQSLRPAQCFYTTMSQNIRNYIVLIVNKKSGYISGRSEWK